MNINMDIPVGMHIYIYIHTQTCLHAYLPTCLPTYIFLYIYIYVYAYTHTQICRKPDRVVLQHIPARFYGSKGGLASTVSQAHNAGVLLIGIGYWGPLYYKENKEPAK